MLTLVQNIIEQNKFINQIRAPGGHIQITIMIDTQQQYINLNIRGENTREIIMYMGDEDTAHL